MQTIASIVGDNKIVATNIINGGQTTVLLPNDPTPVFNVPSLSVTVGVKPSNVEEFSVMPTEVSESGANLEGVSSILQPGLSPTTPASNLEGVGSMLQPGLVPSASPEGGNIEGIGSLLQPGLVPSGAASLPPAMEISSTSVTPSLHEFAFGSESGEVDHTPTHSTSSPTVRPPRLCLPSSRTLHLKLQHPSPSGHLSITTWTHLKRRNLSVLLPS